MKKQEFYCVKCRSKVMCKQNNIKIELVHNRKVKGGIPALRCKCPKCSTQMTKWEKRENILKCAKKFNC